MRDVGSKTKRSTSGVGQMRIRIAELEKVECERQQAEERVEHLNAVLRAIRNVNQLMTREKDRDSLLRGICDRLIETRGYHHVWIALLDDSGKLMACAESGMGEGFNPVLERLMRGELTACGRRALNQPDVVVIEDPVFTCTDCPLSEKYINGGAMTARLEHDGRVYGVVTASIPSRLIAEKEERSLFEELSGDIAFALHSMELEEQERERAEEKLRKSEWELSIRSRIANIFLIVPDDEMYAEVLHVVLEVMESRYGVFGYIDEDGALVCPSMTRDVWSQCQVAGKDIVFPREIWGDSTWQRAIREKRVICTNERSVNVPEGHIPIQRHISLPILYQGEVIGLFQVANKDIDYDESEIQLLETIAGHIATILYARLHREREEKERQRAEEELRQRTCDLEQRVNELDCLYRISYLVEEKGISLEQILKGTADLIPPACQYPEITCARILLDDAEFTTANFRETPWKLSSDIIVHGERAGALEVCYLEERPEEDEGPFLREGKQLINGIAQHLGRISERKRAEAELAQYRYQLEELVEERTRELQDVQEQLVRQEKLAVLGQLAGGVGHELRNPLSTIKGSAYFLNQVLREPEPRVRRTLDMLDREVATCERIISDLLDFARTKNPIQRSMNINDAVREELSHTAVPENIEVVSQLDETLPPVQADPDQLSQVLANIILNAVQAMPGGGRLTISSESPGPGWVAVSFADTGVGMSDETMAKLFEPLFTTKAKGIGLGLAIVRSLVEGHGGTIEAQSEVGRGSTFTVRLPVGGH